MECIHAGWLQAIAIHVLIEVITWASFFAESDDGPSTTHTPAHVLYV